jgi:hypothetical protein
VIKYGSYDNTSEIDTMDSVIMDNALDLDPYLLPVNSIRSPLTRQKYFGRLFSI